MKKSIKAQAALALAVSLWIANGGVASAKYIYLDPSYTTANELTVFDGTSTYARGAEAIEQCPTGSTVTYDSAGKELNITGGDWSTDSCSWSIYGGYSAGSAISGYSLIILNEAKVFEVMGGYTASGDASRNHITLNHCTTTSNVTGGYSEENGDANDNFVTLENCTVDRDVVGGHAAANDAADRTYNATNNNVFLKDSFVTLGVYGGYRDESVTGDVVTGNTLHLLGSNTVQGDVQNFETIRIRHARWGTPALTANDVKNTGGSKPNISAEGIVFTGASGLTSGQSMTLIHAGTGNYAGTISGTNYRVGTTMQGTGRTELVGNDLVYTVEMVEVQEQTHNTVMGASVSMTALSVGNEFIGAATEGLSLAANTGADGVSSFAQMGGGSIRQETGSHVDVHTWNAILGLGHQNKKERSTFEYGAFFEYGTGNYTTHAENDLRGDGSARYTGGGLLAKYTTRNNVYVEGSLRAGSVHDDARNVMSDGLGNPYSYDTNAPYLGFHLGVGKEIVLDDIHSVDVYGKYFFNRKNGVSFDAGGHYDLDAVTSSVIRVGARYTVKRDKWNFYGGLAYEHELDGKATGTADGMEIRGADTSGGSVRAEIGATMKPDKNSPITLDLNLSGFAGKKQGFTGGVSVAFMF